MHVTLPPSIFLLSLALLTGCGSAPRAGNSVKFQNLTGSEIHKQFPAYFEKKLANKTTAAAVTYRITALDEGSRLKRMSFWFNAGAASARIWSKGTDAGGAVLWEGETAATCAWGVMGGSVFSCLDTIAEGLP